MDTEMFLKVLLYKCECPSNYVFKNNYIRLIDTLVGNPNTPTDLSEPVLTIEINEPIPEFDDYTVYNISLLFDYLYIPAFGRYYYVVNVKHLGASLYEFKLKVDVLMSFNALIMLQEDLIVERNEFDFNMMLKDENVIIWDEVSMSQYLGLDAIMVQPAVGTRFLEYSTRYLITTMTESEVYGVGLTPNPNITQFSTLWELTPTQFISFCQRLLSPNLIEGVSDIVLPVSECILNVSLSPISLYESGASGTSTDEEVKVGPGLNCGQGKKIFPYSNWFRFYHELNPFPMLKNFLDIEPFSRYYLYLPYIGTVEIDSSFISKGYKYVVYDLDMVSGNISVTLSRIEPIVNSPISEVKYRWFGNMYTQIPFGSTNLVGRGLQQAISIAGAFVSTVGAISAVANFKAGRSMVDEDTGMVTPAGTAKSVKSIHELSAHSTNAMNSVFNMVTAPGGVSYQGTIGDFLNTHMYQNPIIIKTTQKYSFPENYEHLYGRPLLEQRSLLNVTGYTKLKTIRFNSVYDNRFAVPTLEEINEIISLLLEGVYLNRD